MAVVGGFFAYVRICFSYYSFIFTFIFLAVFTAGVGSGDAV